MAFTTDCPGYPGNHYKLAVFLRGEPLPDVAGVYVACRPTHEGGLQALYVGETGSFYSRPYLDAERHDGLERASYLGWSHIALLSEASRSRRLEIETELRATLNPPCNVQGREAGQLDHRKRILHALMQRPKMRMTNALAGSIAD